MARHKKLADSDLLKFTDLLAIPVQLLNDINNDLKEYMGNTAKQKKKRLENLGQLSALYEFHLKYASEFARLTGISDEIAKLRGEQLRLKEGSKVPPIAKLVEDENIIISTLEKTLSDMGIELPKSVFVDEKNE